MKNIFKYSPGFLVGVILSSAFAGAAAANSSFITNTIDQLWVFVAGDPVLASQVNDNFEYLDLKIDEEVSFLSDDVIANAVSILNNEDGVGVNQSAISQVDSSLSSFQSSQSVRDGDQDVLIADNGARITTLENSGSGGSGLFYPSDLYDYNWDFVSDGGTGPDRNAPLVFGFSFDGDFMQLSPIVIDGKSYFPENAAWQPSDPGYQPHYPLPKSWRFMSDGTLLNARLYSTGNDDFEFSGAMSQDKTKIIGHYMWKIPQWSTNYSGSFVATRQ